MRHSRCLLRAPGGPERSRSRANAAPGGIRAAEPDCLRHVRHRQSRSREGQKAHIRSHAALRRLDRWLARCAGSAAAILAQNQEATVSGHILVWGGGELWGDWVAALYERDCERLGWFGGRLTDLVFSA